MTSCDKRELRNTTFDSLHYSVLSFLESKDKVKDDPSPLDLSVKPIKVEKPKFNFPLIPTRDCNTEIGVESSSQRRNSMIPFVSNPNPKFPGKEVSAQHLYSNLYRYFDDIMKRRVDGGSTTQTSNYMTMNPSWRPDNRTGPPRVPGSFLNFFEPQLPLPFLSAINKESFVPSFFPSQDHRRMFPDIYSRSFYKLSCKDSLEKLTNSIGVKEKDNMYGVCNSPHESINKRRKRTKVTDSRLLKRNALDSLSNPQMDETMAEITPENRCSSPSQSSISEDISNDPKKYTLTPIHLRKAKLMFLFTRYPNSQMLKNYFPDIIFYKQNTAQLVKWFSNFREFYYSEMEKAVQRLMSTGIKFSSDIYVSEDCELFKNLMTHFNKNRQIEVPKEFMIAVQITLREFYDAISMGKNLHQSWKKPIYKTIAKLDQAIPDFFKDFNWMLELAKEEQGMLNHIN